MPIFFAENCRKSPKIVIITSTPGWFIFSNFSAGSHYGCTGKAEAPAFEVVSGLTYLCQHCLVHLGDVARYRHQADQAEAFYRQAIQLAPGSGQAYNQARAILTPKQTISAFTSTTTT
jgi:hypothetical protein